MYIIIKSDKAEQFTNKLHKMKEFVCEMIDCLEEAKEHRHGEYEEDEYSHSYARHEGRRDDRFSRREDMLDDDEMYRRDMARGRGRGRGRY